MKNCENCDKLRRDNESYHTAMQEMLRIHSDLLRISNELLVKLKLEREKHPPVNSPEYWFK